MVTRRTVFVFAACAVWMLSAVYTLRFVDRGWIPHDEGTIAQSAERVLRGEVPHRDFDEVYTGGLTYLNAASMRIFGVSLLAPRWTLFAFFLAFVAATLAIAWRISSEWGAIVATVLVVVWSVPNYFASMPSWYTLFFAVFGTLALLQFLDAGRRRWLFLAGACGGLSVLAKSTGLYYIGGAVLFLAYLEQSHATEESTGAASSRFALVVGLPAALSLLALLLGLGSRALAIDALAVLLPALLACGFLAWREWTSGRGPAAERARRLFDLVWPFAAGVTIPVVLFVAWFWQQGAVSDLVRGVLVLPLRRLSEASLDPPPLASVALAAPYAVWLVAGGRWGNRWGTVVVTALVLACGAALVFGHPVAYRATWAVARAMPLVAVVTLIATFNGLPAERRAQTVLVVMMAAFVALIQFPYSTPIYFCYGAAVTALALTALVSGQARSVRRAHFVIAVYFVVFAAGFVNTSYAWNLGREFVYYSPDSRLDLERGGVRVSASDKETYETLVAVLRERARGGTIYAGPDCPEVYFLSGFPNPTRAIFEFLTPEPQDAEWMAELIDHAPIRAAVINTAPEFSRPLDPRVVAVLERRFPSVLRVGRFVVRFDQAETVTLPPE